MQTHNCWNNILKRGVRVHVSASAMKLILSVFDNFILATANLFLYGFWFWCSFPILQHRWYLIWFEVKRSNDFSVSLKTLYYLTMESILKIRLFCSFFHSQKPVQVDRRLDQGHQHQHPGQTSRSQRINVRPPMQHTTASTKPDASQWKLAIRCYTIASKLDPFFSIFWAKYTIYVEHASAVKMPWIWFTKEFFNFCFSFFQMYGRVHGFTMWIQRSGWILFA